MQLFLTYEFHINFRITSTQLKVVSFTLPFCRTRLYYEGLSHIPVVPPSPDTQPTVDRVAREVSQQSDPDSYEERLRQSHLEALESGGSTGSSGDSAQEYIDKRFLWVSWNLVNLLIYTEVLIEGEHRWS